MDAHAFLEELTANDPETAACLVGLRELRAREPRLDPFPEVVPEIVRSRLGLLGIEGLYPHQSRGLESLRSGRDVILATGTASGKTLVYDIAFAEAAVNSQRPRPCTCSPPRRSRTTSSARSER